jgi:hypothetical protein
MKGIQRVYREHEGLEGMRKGASQPKDQHSKCIEKQNDGGGVGGGL